jgi:hypothetical protein
MQARKQLDALVVTSVVDQRGGHDRPGYRTRSRRVAEPVAEKLLRPLAHIVPAGASRTEERRRPRPRRRSSKMAARLGQHSRDLLVGQSLDPMALP